MGVLPVFPNWLKLVYEPFGQSNMLRTLEFGPCKPDSKESIAYRNQRIATILLSNIYTVKLGLLEALMMKKGLHICPNILLSTKTSVVSRLLHTLSI